MNIDKKKLKRLILTFIELDDEWTKSCKHCQKYDGIQARCKVHKKRTITGSNMYCLKRIYKGLKKK